MAFWQKSGNRSVGPLRRYARSERGNISVMVALLIVPLVGILGMATETGNWFAIQRSMQNAADSAVVAAANNATGVAIPANQTYIQEGQSVATKFGYTNNASTTVTVTYPDNTSIKCVNKCYAVTVQRNVPAYLTRIFGVGATQTVAAKAVAVAADVPTKYCLVSLGPGDGFHVNGGPSIDLAGCNVLSNGDITCNGSGSNGGANSITYYGTNKKCAPAVQKSPPTFIDPYLAQASKLPTNTCPAYAQVPISGSIAMNLSLPGITDTGKMYCGNVTLSADVTVTTDIPGGLMVIENGTLDLNGHTLQTASGSALTIIFSGASGGLASSLSGTFDFSAPTTGNWAGYALYQNPTLPVTTSTASGSGPTWNISGLIYLPRTDLTFKGAVNKAHNGLDCFVLVDYAFQASGTGNILENQSQCVQQGVNLPTNSSKRIALVY